MRRILLTGSGYTQEHFARLESLAFEVIHEVEIAPARFRSLLPTVDAHILGGSERLDSAAIASATRLRVISFVGTGYGAFVNEAAARARGIEILNTPSVMAQDVAEHTVGLLLGLARGLFAQNESVKRLGSCPQSTLGLANTVVGIVGMGAIGARVARILTKGFGCKTLYTSRSRKAALENELGLEFFNLDELFAAADAVLLLLPTTPETTNLVNEYRLSIARPGFIIINTASAQLVEPNALRRALDCGQVAAAAFDGYWAEPLPEPASDPYGLLALPDSRFVVTPHTAAKSSGTWSHMVDMAVDNVARAFELNQVVL
jgi:phosphoglycerate dehydrogenase-like enzyme